ncbi:hypothetical protein CCH79_00015681 [Gambusia affinis]|uniref:Uncharacterized protein n=1 Tax=Gambusia affinis TaxID=33528 RepID=A0A315W3H2_GAMAF|nr:hypothetical protein CCH79_00015681 [Gambusia affinis]
MPWMEQLRPLFSPVLSNEFNLMFSCPAVAKRSQRSNKETNKKSSLNGKNMTDLITLINSTSPENLEMCDHTTEGNHRIYMFHFRCLFAKLRGINYENKHEKERLRQQDRQQVRQRQDNCVNKIADNYVKIIFNNTVNS